VEIIVLLKQVPATESMIAIAGDGKSIQTDNIKWVMNPYDEFAVEEALQIKKAQGGRVTVISAGGDRCAEALRTALAMGADSAVLINDPAVENCDGIGIARILAAAVKDIPYDLIITGMRAVDDDNYVVGAAVAEFLQIPHMSMVIKEEIRDGVIRCHSTVEGGTLVTEAPLPALFTCQRGLNEPRYPSLPGIMKAKKKKIETKSLADMGLDAGAVEAKSEITGMKLPPERKAGKMIAGDSAQVKAAELVKLLRKEAKVI
jgi:electron transfer flavoprotein beta subunit